MWESDIILTALYSLIHKVKISQERICNLLTDLRQQRLKEENVLFTPLKRQDWGLNTSPLSKTFLCLENESCSVMSDSLPPLGLYSP